MKKYIEFINEELHHNSFEISLGWAIIPKVKALLYDIARKCDVLITIEKISGHVKVKYNVNVVGEEINISKFHNNAANALLQFNATRAISGEEEWDSSVLGPEPVGDGEFEEQ